jgi:hypothetical protein
MRPKYDLMLVVRTRDVAYNVPEHISGTVLGSGSEPYRDRRRKCSFLT